MLGPVDYALWLVSVLLDAAAVACVIRSRSVRKYFTLSLYMLTVFLLDVSRYLVLTGYGYTSPHYFYFYYMSDAILTIFLYFALMGLYCHVFQEMGVHHYLRVAALMLLAGTAWVSYRWWPVRATGS